MHFDRHVCISIHIHQKKIDEDVKLIKSFLNDKVGKDFAAATRYNSDSRLGIVNRSKVPWEQVINANCSQSKSVEHYTDFVERHVRHYTPWHRDLWLP